MAAIISSILTGEVTLLVAAAEKACVLHELCLLVVRGSLPPAQSQPEEVVRLFSFVQNLAEIKQLTFARQTQPEKFVGFFSFVQNLAEINHLTFAN
jgi:hypothetical protein